MNLIYRERERSFAMAEKLTRKEFRKKSNKIHNNKYNYDKSNYTNNLDKIIIQCPIHGEFLQSPRNHLTGSGCQECGKHNLLGTKEFIKKSNKIHNSKFDYSKVDYKKGSEKVIIKCPIHGEFLQTPTTHLKGFGCSKCSGKYSPTTEEFIKKANEVHNNKYDYSKVDYVDSNTNITIKCPIHGEFLQSPRNHLTGYGCNKCSKHPKLDLNIIISKCKEIFKNKNYEYSKSYLCGEHICDIQCPTHGSFRKLISNHLYLKQGCNFCTSTKLSKEEFVERSNIIHQNKYNYSDFDYKNFLTKSIIKCPTHGNFLQAPKKHLFGRGCPNCNSDRISKGEKFIRDFLNIKGEKYEYNFPIEGKMRMDFYLSNRKICIEYDGEQHFSTTRFKFGSLELSKERDLKKNEYCRKNGIILIRISYKFYHKLDEILNDILSGKYKETTFIY